MRTPSLPLIALMLFVFSSCSKSDTPEKIKETVDPSILNGMVFLYDEGIRFNDGTISSEGMKITLEDANPVVSTVTDSKGAFSLKVDTALKRFTLVYTKPLYGAYKEYYLRSNDTLYRVAQPYYSNQPVKLPVKDNYLSSNPNLGRKSTTVVNSLRTAVIDGKLKIICNVSFPSSTPSAGRYVQLFYQRNTPISSFATIPKTEKNLAGAVRITNNGDNVLDDFCMDCCLKGAAGMHSGDTVYMTAYGTSYFAGNYVDMNTKEIVFSTMNFTNNPTPISFVLP